MLLSAGVAAADTGLHDCGTRLGQLSATGWGHDTPPAATTPGTRGSS
jgi:hypothetical protein